MVKSWIGLYGWRHTPQLRPLDDDNRITRLNTLPPSRRFNSHCRNLQYPPEPYRQTQTWRLATKTTQCYKDSESSGMSGRYVASLSIDADYTTPNTSIAIGTAVRIPTLATFLYVHRTSTKPHVSAKSRGPSILNFVYGLFSSSTES